MKSRMFVLALVGAFLFGMTAYAHHSFGALYSLDKQVKIEGRLLRFLNRNPHGFFHVEARDESGQMQVWSVEGAAATQFARSGISGDTFKIGDPVIITGNPTRNLKEKRLRLVSLERKSDGLSWGKKEGEIVD